MTELPGPDRTRSSRRRRTLKIVVAAVVGVLVIASVGGVLVYRHLNDNIGRIELPDGTDRPSRVEADAPQQPRNVLLIGSDTRKGQTGGIGGDTPGLSDTTIVLHLSADRSAPSR